MFGPCCLCMVKLEAFENSIWVKLENALRFSAFKGTPFRELGRISSLRVLMMSLWFQGL